MFSEKNDVGQENWKLIFLVLL